MASSSINPDHESLSWPAVGFSRADLGISRQTEEVLMTIDP
jgi:hypothetical protein